MTGKKPTSTDAKERPHPKLGPSLLGHEAAEAQMVEAVRSGRLAHAWLIEGPRGIGKATLAFRFARFLLSGATGEGGGLFGDAPTNLDVDPAHRAARLIAAGSHPDLLALERSYDEKAKRLRKGVPLLVGNLGPATFGQDDNRLLLIDDHSVTELPLASKLALARQLVARIAQSLT